MTKSLEALIASINDTIDDVVRLYGDEWDSALVSSEPNYHAITSEKTNDVVVRANDDGLESSWLCDYLESVSPANVKALIAALENAQRQNKLHERAEFAFMNALGLADTADRNEILPGILAANYVLSAANTHIAELESRQLSVKLPDYVDGHTLGYGEVNHAIDLCADAIEKAGHAAGITIRIED